MFLHHKKWDEDHEMGISINSDTADNARRSAFRTRDHLLQSCDTACSADKSVRFMC